MSMRKEKKQRCCVSDNRDEHHHEHGGIKAQILLIAVTALLLAGAVAVEKFCNLATWQLLLVYLVPYLCVGHDTLKEAFEGVVKGEMIL